MKKLFAILLAGIMILSLAACSGDKPDKDDTTNPTSADKVSESDKTGEANEIKTTLFTLAYDDSVWNYLEDDSQTKRITASSTFRYSIPMIRNII